MTASSATMQGQELAGKVALITGGALNIGRAISVSLASAGAAVAINTRTSREQADGVAEQIRSAGGQAEVYLADIANSSSVKEMADAVLKRFGRIDILVLNASVRK
ncbi:MAG: SDR family NAD(P)-dependent oxidoreductase, partial [Burkholderiales bacterium]